MCRTDNNSRNKASVCFANCKLNRNEIKSNQIFSVIYIHNARRFLRRKRASTLFEWMYGFWTFCLLPINRDWLCECRWVKVLSYNLYSAMSSVGEQTTAAAPSDWCSSEQVQTECWECNLFVNSNFESKRFSFAPSFSLSVCAVLSVPCGVRKNTCSFSCFFFFRWFERPVEHERTNERTKKRM